MRSSSASKHVRARPYAAVARRFSLSFMHAIFGEVGVGWRLLEKVEVKACAGR